MSGIKIKTTDKNMYRPAIYDLADGSLFIYLDTIYMKITIYEGDKWCLNMETGQIVAVDPNCEVEVVELHCEVVKANPYHHCKKSKVVRVEEMEEDDRGYNPTGPRVMAKKKRPHLDHHGYQPEVTEEIVPAPPPKKP